MEIIMYLKSNFDAVFMANGVFLENNSCVKFDRNETVYVTVFPLSLALNAYTVKLCGASLSEKNPLVEVYSLSCDKYLALFQKRFFAVFTPEKPRHDGENCLFGEFFDCIKHDNFKRARSLMTNELSSSLDDRSLKNFFGEYRAVVKDDGFISSDKNAFLLLGEDNSAHPCSLTTKNNLIDDLITPEDF